MSVYGSDSLRPKVALLCRDCYVYLQAKFIYWAIEISLNRGAYAVMSLPHARGITEPGNTRVIERKAPASGRKKIESKTPLLYTPGTDECVCQRVCVVCIHVCVCVCVYYVAPPCISFISGVRECRCRRGARAGERGLLKWLCPWKQVGRAPPPREEGLTRPRGTNCLC